MNFRDTYMDDLENAFFDTDEFSSEHMIDGEPVNIVLIKTGLQDAQRIRNNTRAIMNSKENAINKVTTTLYIKEGDIGRKLTANAAINLDGENMWINEVEHMEGMYRLVVGKHKV